MTTIDYTKTMQALRQLKVETGSLACLGCGYENDCSTKGCAIIRNAVEHMEASLSNYDRLSALADKLDEEIKVLAEGIATPDVAPVRHGRWVGIEYDGYADGSPVYNLWECSECGEEVRGDDVPDTHPWCHACGAKMDLEVEP